MKNNIAQTSVTVTTDNKNCNCSISLFYVFSSFAISRFQCAYVNLQDKQHFFLWLFVLNVYWPAEFISVHRGAMYNLLRWVQFLSAGNARHCRYQVCLLKHDICPHFWLIAMQSNSQFIASSSSSILWKLFDTISTSFSNWQFC